MDPFRNSAAGVVSSAKLFRPEGFAELTTITASRCRARASRPSAALRWLRNILLMPQPPLLFKGINILDASCGRANSPPQLRRGGRDIKKISRSLLIRSGQGGAGQ